MLKIKRIDDDEGKWFLYMPGVEIKVRPLTGSVVKELRKRCSTTKMEINPRTRKQEAVEVIDEAALEEALVSYLVEDFKGFGDERGNPLEINESNKALIANNLTLRDFIWSSAQSLDIVSEEQSKNS